MADERHVVCQPATIQIMTSRKTGLLVALVTIGFALLGTPVLAQELAPRAYIPLPRGTNVVGLGYSYTDGDILVDPAAPVDDVENGTHSLAASYYRSFGLAGRSASLAVTLPAAASRIRGELDAEEVGGSISGMSDLHLRLGVNLLGAPAMRPQEYQQFWQQPPRSILGVSLKVQVPTGEYNNDRVANVGTSRWAVKPELGYILRLGTTSGWGLETALGAWFYGDNDDFLGDRLKQEPMYSAEIHLVHVLAGGQWLALDMNFYQGGQTTRAGDRKDNRQRNSRYGVTFALPLEGGHLVRAAFSDSWRIDDDGGDYFTIALSWSYSWR